MAPAHVRSAAVRPQQLPRHVQGLACGPLEPRKQHAVLRKVRHVCGAAQADVPQDPRVLEVQSTEEPVASSSGRIAVANQNGGGPPGGNTEEEPPIDWTTTLVCFMGPACGGLLFGYDIGATSGALKGLFDPVMSGTDWYGMTALDRGEIVSLTMVGACLASLVALIGQDRLGRRKELILAACCYGVASAVMGGAQSESMLLAGRLLYGLGIGFAMHGAPAYIAETVPQSIRGLALTCKEMLIVVGILLGYVVSYELASSPEGWRYIYLASSIPAAVLGGIMVYLPESPRWSLLHGENPQYARSLLRRIRKTDTNAAKKAINRELGAMYANVERCKSDSKSTGEQGLVGALYKQSRFRTPLLIGCSLMLFQQITGQPSVLYYATQIFEAAGADAQQASTYTLWVGVLKILGTLVAVWQVDKLGRRVLLLGGVGGMVVALGGLSLGTSDAGLQLLGGDLQANIALGSLLVYVACYQFSFGPMSWLICGELFPLAVRGPAMALATMTNFSANCLVALELPNIQEEIGISNMYLLFSAITVIALLTFYFTVPETKGKSLEEIEAMFDTDERDGGGADGKLATSSE